MFCEYILLYLRFVFWTLGMILFYKKFKKYVLIFYLYFVTLSYYSTVNQYWLHNEILTFILHYIWTLFYHFTSLIPMCIYVFIEQEYIRYRDRLKDKTSFQNLPQFSSPKLQLKTACNCSSGGFIVPLWLPQEPAHMQTLRQRHIHKTKNLNN